MSFTKQGVYKQQSVQTASPGELTLMLYNGCLKQIRLGKLAAENGEIEQANTAIGKAEAIIRELMVTLKTDSEVGANMMRMYEYILHQLIKGNIEKSPEALEEAETYVAEFRNTWKQVIQLERQNRFQGGQAK
ncbi:flagellar export chaperone FliS [Shouchella clausii]|jgi:flagellar secretion chaperone FliS|uniref:Flagellar secretion chaperone FliS n=3 Tax=Shouchella TaxID=2893057 RepID=Q5WDF3_SHOC1|nr:MULTISPECIES: flagellar export chaperone FliS [Shouchella]MCM3313520.1 flagellar export chaperone FliS [Psychrobacillus sp. MER TA 17]ALA54050.1 Flagellar biosynthesis protein FliS [Shouchella clausii]KKI87495.1 flagellar biosynthesis protein FliS [Shouchella clausii]MBU3229396.1 flagellar export chaperone FliS [Shouchella clausii]MBU3265382.1 flagellar export chaperone FliS [Shouchella clausii]